MKPDNWNRFAAGLLAILLCLCSFSIELLSFTSAIEGSSLSLSKSILHDFGRKRHPV